MAGSNTERVTRSATSDKDESLIQKIIERVLISPLFLEKLTSSLTEKLAVQDGHIKVCTEKVELLENKYQELNNKLESLEQYSRKNNLRIFGVPKVEGKHTESTEMRYDVITIAHINIRSLVPKINYLKSLVEDKCIDILIVSETWLNPNISSGLVYINNYTFLRSDRVNRIGGGVGIYLRNTFKFSRIATSSAIEQLWISVGLGNKKIGIGAVYNPPHANTREFLDILEDSVVDCQLIVDEIFCLGDFNIDLLKNEQPSTILINEFFNITGITQLINSPTRLTETSRSLLDLILVTDDGMIVEYN
ncbi:hypothetical protein QE152_g31479 [Popillia japonica]|uniref:Endonuclease/exonuclease/phosphatase domain-containing protein n=1 Tax=Popillia japonica TaxID=7064 RepID=A0AAW1J1F0_POPJA